MKVADLYAALRLEVDKNAFKKGDDKLKQLGERIAKFGKDANKAFGRGLNVAAAGLSAVIVAGAKDALDFDKALTALYLGSNRTMGTQAEMRESFLRLSQATGIAKESLVEAAQKYVELTGDGKGAAAAVETFARVATASSSSIEDVGGAAAALSRQFGILPSNMEHAFDILIAGGKQGAVELKNMQTLLPSLGAKFKEFGNAKGEGGLSTLGALFQVEAGDTKNAEEAAVNLENLFAKIKTRKGELAKIGVKVENGKTGSNDYKDIITIIKLLGAAKDKDFNKFGDAFGTDMQATAALDTTYRHIAAVEQMRDATMSSKAVTEDLAYVQQQASFRAAKAWNDVKIAIANAFTPERVEAIARLLEKISSAIVTIIDAVGGAEHAVWLMVGAWTALKAIQVSGMLIPIVTQLTTMAAAGNMAAASALNAAGALGKVGALAGALGAGYAAGTWISHQLGLNEGDAGYNNDSVDPAYTAQKAKNKAARDAAAGIISPSASVAIPSAAGAPGGANVTMQTTINVDGSRNPEQTGREVRRQQEGVLRDTAAALGGG